MHKIYINPLDEAINMDLIIRVGNRGTITLPAEIREKYGIDSGDILRLADFDGLLVLTPMVPIVLDVAREIEKSRREAGLGIEDLLQGLRDQRERYLEQPDATDET